MMQSYQLKVNASKNAKTYKSVLLYLHKAVSNNSQSLRTLIFYVNLLIKMHSSLKLKAQVERINPWPWQVQLLRVSGPGIVTPRVHAQQG